LFLNATLHAARHATLHATLHAMLKTNCHATMRTNKGLPEHSLLEVMIDSLA
jgi:hypothetical protein